VESSRDQQRATEGSSVHLSEESRGQKRTTVDIKSKRGTADRRKEDNFEGAAGNKEDSKG
jgi:hypothetical protein